MENVKTRRNQNPLQKMTTMTELCQKRRHSYFNRNNASLFLTFIQQMMRTMYLFGDFGCFVGDFDDAAVMVLLRGDFVMRVLLKHELS